jgi:hypothetical protein
MIPLSGTALWGLAVAAILLSILASRVLIGTIGKRKGNSQE